MITKMQVAIRVPMQQPVYLDLTRSIRQPYGDIIEIALPRMSDDAGQQFLTLTPENARELAYALDCIAGVYRNA